LFLKAKVKPVPIYEHMSAASDLTDHGELEP
jgi:hypothetical protein